MNYVIAMIFLVVGGLIALFEFHPAVEYNRYVVPEHISGEKNCDCHCILNSRPWYSTINYWSWLWYFSIAFFLVLVRNKSCQIKSMAIILIVIWGHIIAIQSIDLAAEIRNELFVVRGDLPDQLIWDDPGPECVSPSSASRVFIRIIGWLETLIYIGFLYTLYLFIRNFIPKKLNYKICLMGKISVGSFVIAVLYLFLMFCLLFIDYFFALRE